MAFLNDSLGSHCIYGNRGGPTREWSREHVTLAVFGCCVAFWGAILLVTGVI